MLTESHSFRTSYCVAFGADLGLKQCIAALGVEPVLEKLVVLVVAVGQRCYYFESRNQAERHLLIATIMPYSVSGHAATQARLEVVGKSLVGGT